MTIFRLMHRIMAAITLASCCFLVNAGEPEQTKANSLSEQADDIKQKVEQEQLQKARDAAMQTQEREKKVLKRQESTDWQSQQKQKAQQQFNQRESREQKYLREAREAANKEQKIPKP